MLNKDLLNNMEVKHAALATMTVVDAVQDLRPHVQVAALSATFLLICERYGIKAQDAFSVITNIMNHADGLRPEFNAVRTYLEKEL